MTPLGQVKLIVGILALVFTIALGGAVVWQYQRNAEKAAQFDTMKADLAAAHTAIDENKRRTEALDTMFAEKLRTDAQRRTDRAEKTQQFTDLKNEDQAVADWADQPVPQRVRQLDAPRKD